MTRWLALASLTGLLLAASPAPAADRTAVFQVEGMTCGLCSKAIHKALGDLDGVRTVEVDRDAERVTVVADAGLSDERLEQAIESAGGFEATPVE